MLGGDTLDDATLALTDCDEGGVAEGREYFTRSDAVAQPAKAPFVVVRDSTIVLLLCYASARDIGPPRGEAKAWHPGNSRTSRG
jgi:hypothetical protein